jgi:phage repressor protein C with HTH and peptisase S24 domain
VAGLETAALQRLLAAVPVFERALVERAPEAARSLKEMRLKAGTPAPTGPSPAREMRDLPVLSAASRNVDIAAARFEAAPMMTQRPPFLADDGRAFAFLVTDTSLAPRYDAGDLLYVASQQTVVPGVDAVIERMSGGFLVGRLLDSRTGARPLGAAHAEITAADIKGVYRVVGVQRLG